MLTPPTQFNVIRRVLARPNLVTLLDLRALGPIGRRIRLVGRDARRLILDLFRQWKVARRWPEKQPPGTQSP